MLVNQQRYADATAVLSQYLQAGGGEINAHCAKMWLNLSTQGFAGVSKEAMALADRFPQNTMSQPEVREPEEGFSDAARFLGTLFAYLERVRPDSVDAKVRSEDQKQILKRLGQMYAPDFEIGQQAVPRRLRELQSQDILTTAEATASKAGRLGATGKERGRPGANKRDANEISPDSQASLLSTYAPFPYEKEKRHVLDWFAK